MLQSENGFLATLSAVLGLSTSSVTAHAVNGNKGHMHKADCDNNGNDRACVNGSCIGRV